MFCKIILVTHHIWVFGRGGGWGGGVWGYKWATDLEILECVDMISHKKHAFMLINH
jgi:hypothetical protein